MNQCVVAWLGSNIYKTSLAKWLFFNTEKLTKSNLFCSLLNRKQVSKFLMPRMVKLRPFKSGRKHFFFISSINWFFFKRWSFLLSIYCRSVIEINFHSFFFSFNWFKNPLRCSKCYRIRLCHSMHTFSLQK